MHIQDFEDNFSVITVLRFLDPLAQKIIFSGHSITELRIILFYPIFTC